MKRILSRGAGALLLAAASLLAGCAGPFLVESNVQSFSSLPAVPSEPRYRFERLPSQQAAPMQPQLELLADPALHRAGLRRDDAAPRYSVQVTARVQRVMSPYADPWYGGWGFYGPGYGLWAPFPAMDSPWYQREIGVVLRDLGSNQVVYESHAHSDGPWFNNELVLPAMFDAALQGFPAAPAGPRRVNVQVAPTPR
ncbi:DUF4136 domain-containing protein [uncultured Ramlibacter sp.]|uniref:DUF4136 domain-containing protein n=1 Tax=uncultured Ramlibacter sp. TaxID=260755 RepID=UPI00261BABCE|nr:DUF4136 domain-containing protein [uncultured Ramlibacter sp.]